MRWLGILLVTGSVALAIPRGPPGWGSWGNHGCKNIQHNFGRAHRRPDPRAESVKQAYLDAWNTYAKYAFGYDEVLPVSDKPNDSYGWALTMVDGLDTALIMGLTDVADTQLAFIEKIDFTTHDSLPDQFDTTIRWIGGLLSAYDLIRENKVPNARHYNRRQIAALLKQAKTLADRLKPCFDTPSGLPHFFVNITTGETSDGPFPYLNPLDNKTYTAITNTAIAGTIILEFHRLSDLTGDESYRGISDRSEANLVNPKPEPIYPNLVGSMLDLNTGEFFAYDAGWQSGIDSFYEYLIKSAIYNPKASTASQYKDFWITVVESTQQHLVTHPYNHPEITWITQLNESGSPRWYQDDYACFAGGNFLLGGAYLDRPDFKELGLAHADSCHRTFNSTTSDLNAVSFAWYGPDNELGAGSANYTNVDRGFFDENGFFIVNGLNTLFPEPIESMFYAWRITGDTKWQDYNWEVFQAYQKAGYLNADTPMSCFYDVEQPGGGGRYDALPSYYFAETLKYWYLTFSDPDLVSVDDFVWNTEGHPLRVQAGTCSSPHGGWW